MAGEGAETGANALSSAACESCCWLSDVNGWYGRGLAKTIVMVSNRKLACHDVHAIW